MHSRWWLALILLVPLATAAAFFAASAGKPRGTLPVPPPAEPLAGAQPAVPPSTAGQAAVAHAAVGQPGAAQRVSPPPELLLAESEREYLWQCEHQGNLLSQVGFSRVAQILQGGDEAALAGLLTEHFHGTVPGESWQPQAQDGAVWVARVRTDPATARQLGPDPFAAWLFAVRRELVELTRPPRFELISLAPVARGEVDGPWKGHARLRMTGTTRDQRPCDMAIRFDFRMETPNRERLSQQPWLIACEVTQLDVVQSSQILMREVARERGFDTDSLFDNWEQPKGKRLVTTGGVYLCDFNRDAWTDVLITAENTPHSVRFYQGLPEGRFTDVTYKIGLPDIPFARHVVVIDIDNDGWEDLVFLGQAIFRNRSGKIFQNVTAASNLMPLLEAAGGGITGGSVADYDRDGLPDLYVTRGDDRAFKEGSWIDGKSGHSSGNQLLRNRGEGMFEDVTATAGVSGNRRSVFTANWLDANDDGWPDLYVIHEFGAGVLLVNRQDGSFEERQIAKSSEDFGSMGLTTGDVDNDGRIDIYSSNMYSKAGNRVMDHLTEQHYDAETLWKLRRMVAGSQLHVNQGDLTFAPHADRAEVGNVGWGWGAAMADLNNDGWLDLHATCGFMSYDRSKPDG